MVQRIKVQGRLCVYRDGHIKQFLAAELIVGRERFHYYPCPKCFEDLVTALDNECDIEVVVNGGDDVWVRGRNPRNPKRLS